MNNPYIGQEAQICGVETYQLLEGKGKGMRLFEVVNGKGLRMTISADRCADISRLSFQGNNFSYFSPSGYVAPQYYDRYGDKFLNSFTAGFLTTCGLTNAGVACKDQGEQFPLHGVIGNTPANHIYYDMDEENIIVRAKISDERIFSRKLILEREIKVSKLENSFSITDTITNRDYKAEPVSILYHYNIGYPLLSETSCLYISSTDVIPRDARAQEGIQKWSEMEKPQGGFEEQCYTHIFNKTPNIAIFNEKIGSGLKMSFDHNGLNYFTQWKLMGERDYVLGLEPGNTHVLGRDIMRQEKKLKILEAEEKVTYQVEFKVLENIEAYNKVRELNELK